MEHNEKSVNKKVDSTLKTFFKGFAELGGTLTYLFIIMASVAYDVYGIIPIAFFGLVCSLYNITQSK